jgi:hypothetical protein
MRASGHTYDQIHAATGLYRSKNSWITFFSNKLYIGILEYGDLVIQDYCPPVVDRHTWDAVQKAQQRLRRKPTRGDPHHPRRTGKTYLLSGLAYCARCGSPLSGHTIKKWHYYACTLRQRRKECDAPKVPRDALEKTVLAELKQSLLSPLYLQDIHAQYLRAQDEFNASYDSDRKGLARQLGGLRRRIARIASAIAEAGHSRALLDKLSELERQEARLQTQIEDLDRSRALAEQHLALDDLQNLASSLVSALEHAPHEELVIILRGLVSRILVSVEGKTIQGTIQFYLPPEIKNPPPGNGEGVNKVYGECPHGDSNPGLSLERATS